MSTIYESHESASAIGIGRDYITLSAGWINLLWLLYPIAFGLSEGGNLIGVSGSSIFFSVLDMLSVPVLARKWDFSKPNLDFSEYRGVRQGETLERKEEALAAGGVASAA